MYNKRKFNKVNDKKVLHKVKKQWVVLSLSMLAMIGAGGAIVTQTHASTVNAPQVQQEKQVAPQQQTPNDNKQSTPVKPVTKVHTQAQNTPVSTTDNGNKGKQLSLSDDASSTVHQTPSIDDIVSAVDSNTWNSQYGSKYTDLLSNLNYNNVQVFDNPTAYSNYLYGNSNVPQTNQYQNALTNVKQDLNGFAAYSRVQSLQNLINTTTTNPSTYSPIFSNPLFNGFETTFNNNDANTYNGILNNFKSLETDRNNNADQASDLRNALNGLNSLSNSAKEAVTKFYGISSSDISNEIDRLNSGYTPQEMVYQPIELKYYDIASKTDHNADNEHVAIPRTPVGTVTLNESDFGNSNPQVLINNPSYDGNGMQNPPMIAKDQLQVPNGYVWDGLYSPKDSVYDNNLPHDYGVDSYNVNGVNYTYTENATSFRNYHVAPQQQLHFHLVPKSEVSQPETIVAYVRTNNNVDDISNNTNNAFSISWLHQHGTELYKGPSNDPADGVYGVSEGNALFIGGNFYQYCIDNSNELQSSHGQTHQNLLPDNIKNNVSMIFLEDSKGLNGTGFNNSGNCSYMFSNLPYLTSVYRDGFFGANDTKDNIKNSASDISYMFANDPKLLLIENNNPSSWDFDNGCIADNVFYNDPMLSDITGLSKWNTTGFVSMNHMFDGDKNLSDYSPISNWDVGGVSQMNYTFANAESADHGGFTDANLGQLVPWNLRQITSAEGLFEGDMWIDNISSWMNKPIGTGNEYPDVKDAFKNTGFSFTNNALTSAHPAWVPLNSGSVDQELDGSWIPKMYRTENGNYSFTPDPNVIYLGDPFHGISATYYKKDNYLLISSNDYTIDSSDHTEQENYILPSRNQLLDDLKSNGIDPNNINSIGLIGQFGAPSLTNGSLNHYFSNLSNLRSITFGYYSNIKDAYDYNGTTIPYPVDVTGLFANDPKLDSVIGFFGNEQALKGDPYASPQSTGLIHKLNFNKNTPVITHNLFEDAPSTACMFDGDRNLFADDNAKANIDAISNIPMDNITDASYMFRNTGLNDSNIVTNWNLSKLQHADYMFAGCNLTNLNGFSKLGDWTNKHYYVPYRLNPVGDGEPTADANGVQDGYSDNSSDKVTKIVPNKLQSASYMFANNPHLTDLSGISGNNIDINPITNVSHMFDGDTDLTDVSSIENGNNNWRFNQQPNVSDMFSNTNVGYDAPKVENNYGQFILGAMPKQDNDHIDFNGDASKDTIVRGDDGTNSSVNAPEGYHFINGSNGQFTFNHGTHTFNVAPDTMAVPVEFQDTTNGSFLDLNPNANGQFTVNTPGTISLNNDVLSQLHQQGYQLSSSNNYSFTVTPEDVNNSGNLNSEHEPTLNVTPINFSIPVEYKDVEKGVTKSVNPITNQTIHSTPDLTQYAQQHVPSGYQLVTNNQNNDLSTWKVADHIKPSSNNTDTLVVYMEPVQAKAEVNYIGNNGAVNPNPSIIGSGDEYSSTKVGHTPVGLPNGYTVTNPNQSITYNNQAQNVNVTPENFNVPFNVVTPDNSNVLFNGTSANKVTVDSSANLELPMTDINNTLHSKGYVLNNPNTNFMLKHGDITNANKFNANDTPNFAASDISATLPVKFENAENHNQVIGNTQTISGVKANTQNNISSKINVPTNYQLASGNVDLTKYSFDNTNLGTNNKVTSLVVYVRPAQQQALVVYKNGNTPVNATPISLGSGDTSALNLANSKFKIGAHPSTLPSGYQISNPNQVMYYDNQPQDVAVTPIQATSTVNYEYNDHDVTDNTSTKNVTGNQSVGKTTFDLASLTVPNGYQLTANNPTTDAYKSGHVTVNVTPVQATDAIVYKNGSQTVTDSNSTNSVKGNKVIAPNSFNTSSLVLPNGYQLVGNGTTYTYNGSPVEVQVAPKPTMTTIHYEYNGQPLNITTKPGVYNASFDTSSLNLPNGYNLANSNQTIPDSNADVTVNLVPQQKTDTINFVDNQGNVSTTHVTGNSSATGLVSSHFTVGNAPTGLPSGYQVEDPNQVINYDGGNYNIMIKPVSKPTPKPQPVTPSKPSSGSTASSSASVKPSSSNNGSSASSSASTNSSKNSSTNSNARPSSANNGSATSSANTSKNNSSASSSASSSNVKPTSNSTNSSSASHNASSASTNNSKSNSSTSANVQPSSANSSSTNSSANTSENNSSASSNASNSAKPSSMNSSHASSTNSSSTNIPKSSTANSTASNSTQPSSTSSNTSKSNGSINSSTSMNSSAKSNSTSSASNTSNASSTSTNIPESASSTTPVMPIAPTIPSSSVSPSSVASTSASNSINNASVASVNNQSSSATTGSNSNSASVAKPYKTRTDQGYVIQHNASHSNHDVVTYHGRKHVVHYHANGKNTIRVRERMTKNGKRMYHYKNVVVSTNLPTNNVPEPVIRAVDTINFNQPAKHVWSWKSANKVLNQINVGEVIDHYGTKMARISVPAHYRYFIVNKQALAHLLINKVGKSADKYALPLKKELVFHINRIIVMHGHHGNYVRYEFKLNKHNLWITARGNYVRNAYLQTGDVKGRKIKVTRKCCLYTSPKYSKHTLIRSIKPGVKLSVKKVIFLGKKSNYQTRLLLSNGDYVTANKQFVEVI